ncbi:MAG TPA: hypothetical protein VMT87_00355, partial [Vicinamibacteria bacterium]|nr:hypothetical protein [Vicinamibacteria bacterium]
FTAPMRVFVDQSVPDHQGDVVRQTVGAMLAPMLEGHPQYARLAALVGQGPKGWTVTVIVLDPNLAWDGQPTPSIGTDLFDAVREALRLL